MVTGATGFIGSKLTEELLNRKFQVTVLVRSPHKLMPSLREKVMVVQGDVRDLEQVDRAMKNTEVVFHLAAFAGIWAKDKSLPYRVNVTGTKNILDAALRNKVQKVVFTSSAGTLAPSETNEVVDENSPLPETYLTDYERSKLQAEQLCMEYSRRGLPVVVVNPTRVFGPGPLNKSNSVTLLIKNYLAGTWRFLPANGEHIGNYSFVDDVVNGHLLALHHGKPGEKYILGGTNVSFREFFRQLAAVSGKNYKLVPVPFPLIYAFSKTELFLAEIIGKKPVITPSWAKRYLQNRLVSSSKAANELGYEITPLPKVLEATTGWLKRQG